MKYELTKEQLRLLTDPKVKEWFPEVFKPVLEVGKWYKNNDKGCKKSICFVVNLKGNGHEFAGYGFDCKGIWFYEIEDVDFCGSKNWTEAPEAEVFEDLKNEAVKRYKEKMIVPLNINLLDGYKNNYQELYFEKYCRLDEYNRLWVNFGKWNAVVFDNGKWAEIIPTKTKAEAEKELNCKIVD